MDIIRGAAEYVDFLGVEGPSFMPTVTHFWNADNGISNSTFLHGEQVCVYWSLYAPNAYAKAKRYFEGYENNNPYWITARIHAIPIQDVFDYPYPQLTYPYVYSEPYGINNLYLNGTTRLYDWVPPGIQGDLITEPTDTFHFSENYRVHLSMNILGKILHLLADMSVPAHVHNDEHAARKLTITGSWHTGFCDKYEGWLTHGDGGFMAFEENWYWDYYNTLNQKGGYIDISQQDDPLLFIMYTVNQIADFFASDDVDGDSDLPQGSNSIIDAMYSELETIYSPDHPVRNSHEMTSDESAQIRDTVFPFVIRATAGVLKWFAEENNLTQILVYPLPNLVSGNVSLNGGSGDITDVQIKFDPQTYGIPNVYLNPDENGNYSHTFSYDRFDTYDVTYELYSTDGDYYKEIIVNVEINETTSPLTLDITLHPISDPTNVLVSNDENIPAFRNIQHAVEYLSSHNSGTIRILAGTYTGDRNINITWTPNYHVTIIGIDDCIIDCGGSEIAFKFLYHELYSYNENDMIDNLTIINARQGIVIEHGSPVIKNNTIENCTIYDGYAIPQGAGICCKSSATIENNEILNNTGNWSLGNETYGGGIYVENNTEGTVLIKNNMVSGNSAYNGGGIYCTGSGKIILDWNEITLNTLVQGGGSFPWPENGTGIHCETCADIEVRNNLIYNNLPYGSLDYSLGLLSNCENVIVENNTIVCNTNQTGIKLKTTSPAIINNNIVSENGKGICIYSGDAPVITYCCVNNNTYDNYVNVSPGIGCLTDVDPELDEETYQPLWISDVKSPCIDTGDPTITDVDGTPSDIGAVRAVTHKYDTIELPSPEENNGWKWLSFPALDNVYSTPTYDPDVAEYLLYDIMQGPIPTILDKVEAEDYTILWNGSYWLHDDEQFLRTEGFKFHMNDAAELDVPGFKVADNTTIVLDGNNVENWVGYWLDETQHVSDAFSDYWSGSNINFIQHQFWTAFYLGRWRIMLYGGCEEPTLSYGDMVIVKCNTTINDFQWDSGTPVERIVFSKPEYFTFEEQADYIPLYIELDKNNMPQEIGAFVNGECIGAVVVEDTLTQINAYTTSVPPGNIELELYYGGRSENQHISSYNCVTSSKPNIVMKQLSTKMSGDAWFIDLREDSSMIPAPSKVSLSNYPNPFNPTTTISYSLPQEGKVSLKIYNVKGQLVKQLIDGSQPEGYYEVVWNGKDNAGRSVASGIYYYRINACGKTINKKMLLLK